MDKRIEKSLEENTGITEEFEELSKDCFERIFDMLGKRNFERWIDKRKLSPRIKEFHFITDNGDNFPTFIDEGLTE